MKKTILLSLATAVSLFAFDFPSIDGEIAVGAGVGKSDNRLIVHGDDDEDFDETTAMPMVMAKLKMGDLELSLGGEGLKALYDVNDKLDVYIGYKKEDTWENPFLTGSARGKTSMDILISGVDYQAMDWLKVGYKYTTQDISTETTHEDDKRSGDIHTISATVPYKLAQNLMSKNTLKYELGSFDGKGNDYNAVGLATSLDFKVLENTKVSTKLYYEHFMFSDNINYFNEERDENEYGLSIMARQGKLFGYQDLFGFVRAGYEKYDSNIDFYDYSQYKAGLGIGYQF